MATKLILIKIHMRPIALLSLIFLVNLCTNAQLKGEKHEKSIYLQKSNGRVKKIKFKEILEFKLDSITVTGRIKSVSENSITLIAFDSQYAHGKTQKILAIESIREITNRLVNNSNLSDSGGWMIAGAIIGLVFFVPAQWITAGSHAALVALGQMGLLAGGGMAFQIPYLFKKNYTIASEWVIITK